MSSQIITMSFFTAQFPISSNSSFVYTKPDGFCGEFKIIATVLSVLALSKSDAVTFSPLLGLTNTGFPSDNLICSP